MSTQEDRYEEQTLREFYKQAECWLTDRLTEKYTEEELPLMQYELLGCAQIQWVEN